MTKYFSFLAFFVLLLVAALGGCRKGCTDPASLNYDKGALRDDELCNYTGCTDPNAGNYEPRATISNDTTCTYCRIWGALNFDLSPGIDDTAACRYLGTAIIYTTNPANVGRTVSLDGNPVGDLELSNTPDPPSCSTAKFIRVKLAPDLYNVTLSQKGGTIRPPGAGEYPRKLAIGSKRCTKFDVD